MVETVDVVHELGERAGDAIEDALSARDRRKYLREIMDTKCREYSELALQILRASTGQQYPFRHGWAWTEPIAFETASGRAMLGIEGGSYAGNNSQRFYRITAQLGQNADRVKLYEFGDNYPAYGNVVRDAYGVEVSEACEVANAGVILAEIARAHGIEPGR